MTRMLVTYAATFVTLVVIDAVWLGLVMRTFYRSQIGGLMRDDVGWAAALGFYLIYAAGIMVFAIAPAQRSGEWTTAAGLGALLGLVAYATYNLSNLATLKGFPATMALVDMAWGTVFSAASATLVFLATRAITKM